MVVLVVVRVCELTICTAVFLKRIESSMLTQLKLSGVADIRKVFIRSTERTEVDQEKEVSFP